MFKCNYSKIIYNSLAQGLGNSRAFRNQNQKTTLSKSVKNKNKVIKNNRDKHVGMSNAYLGVHMGDPDFLHSSPRGVTFRAPIWTSTWMACHIKVHSISKVGTFQ